MDINSYIASGMIELYVLNICSEEERNELEQLRQQHPEINIAILEYEKNLEQGLIKNGIDPSAAVDEKIMQNFTSLQPLANPAPVKRINYGWLKLVAAAAILLFIASAIFNYTLYQKLKNQQAMVADKPSAKASLPPADYSVMLNPKITPVAMYGVGIHAICRCTMFWDKNTGKMYIMIHHLPLSSASRDYQLWAMVDGKPISVGIIKDEIRGRFIEMPNVPAGAKSFTVTLENAGGTTEPTVSETYLSGSI